MIYSSATPPSSTALGIHSGGAGVTHHRVSEYFPDDKGGSLA